MGYSEKAYRKNRLAVGNVSYRYTPPLHMVFFQLSLAAIMQARLLRRVPKRPCLPITILLKKHKITI